MSEPHSWLLWGAEGETAFMYLARVALGNPYVTNKEHPRVSSLLAICQLIAAVWYQIRRPPTLHGQFDGEGAPTAEQRFDSVVYDGTRRNYREFMVQCLPLNSANYKVFTVIHSRVIDRCTTARGATLNS